jgi:hypothetical protein
VCGSARLNLDPLDAVDELTKPQRRAIRELLGEAHEAEIGAALLDVEAALSEWRSGKILPSEVNARIHEYHKAAQQIFKTYNYLEPMLALSRAVVFGFIKLENIPEALRPRVNELQSLVRPDGGI